MSVFPGTSVECVAGDALISFSISLASAGHHIRGKGRARGLFVPTYLLEVIANVLFIKGRLRLAGRVMIGGPEARGVRRQRLVDPNQFLPQQPKFEFRVGNDDPACGRMLGGTLVERQARFPKAIG